MYFQIYNSFKMIKVECSSWFVENLLIMLTTRLSLLLASVPFSKRINWVNLRHKSNKLTTALDFYHFKRSVNLEVHLLFFCHLQWGIWSVLVKKIPQFWPFCYIFESIHVIRLKPHWTNKNPEEIPDYDIDTLLVAVMIGLTISELS